MATDEPRGSAEPEPDAPPGDSKRTRERTWTRAAALLLVTMTMAVFPPLILVIVPFALLVFTAPGRRFLPLVAAALGAVAVLGGVTRTGMWYVERGWTILVGGCFAALTLRWPTKAFMPRALGAVALALAGGAAVVGLQSNRWTVVDWMISDRLREGVADAVEAVRLLQGGAPLNATVVSAVYRAAEFQAHVFPAILALSSMAALGVAWWLYVRLVRERHDGLGPFRDFRFNDQLVWVLVLGSILVALRPEGPFARAGLNALCFMAALYVVRGAAVVADVTRGLSPFAWVMLVVGILLLPPFVVAGAFLIGVGDTWLDVRSRMREG